MGRSFADLKSNLKRDFTGLRVVRVAVVGDCAVQHACAALRGAGFDAQLDLRVHEASADQLETALLDPSSELWEGKPQYVLVLPWVERLYQGFQALPPAARANFAEEQAARFRRLFSAAQEHGSRVLVSTFPELSDGVFGSFAARTPSSWLHQVRKLNAHLAKMAETDAGLFIHDVAALVALHGAAAAFDNRLSATATMPFAIDFLPAWASSGVNVLAALEGRFKKCLVLDLDNTLWGGIIGDDGVEGIEIGGLGLGVAFSRLQAWAKMLKERGVILTVASKNTESVAAEPFKTHPEMVLRLDDIAVFAANWENKADNIRRIQGILEIGFDSMVFVDDNPVERELVRRELPDVCVPEIPEDPAEVLPFLQQLELFETVSLSAEDGERTALYQQEAKRRSTLDTFTNTEDFLRSLQMVAEVQSFGSFNIPRVAQLTQRSNQFNLRTVRYTEDDIRRVATSPEHRGMAFTLTDSFGPYGLISVVILRALGAGLFIDTWLMSCRVLKRTMEEFVLDRLVQQAKKDGFETLIGEYIPTKKNGLVKDHYASLGFALVEKAEDGRQSWQLAVQDYVARPMFIAEAAQ